MKYFISGHTDLSDVEFETEYVPQIDNALKDSASIFVVGDAFGADSKANEYLSRTGIEKNRVIVHHLGEKPLNGNPGGFCTIGGYKNHESKDSAMTDASDIDILYIRSIDEQRKIYGSNYRYRISGTEKNKNRRRKCLDQKFFESKWIF